VETESCLLSKRKRNNYALLPGPIERRSAVQSEGFIPHHPWKLTREDRTRRACPVQQGIAAGAMVLLLEPADGRAVASGASCIADGGIVLLLLQMSSHVVFMSVAASAKCGGEPPRFSGPLRKQSLVDFDFRCRQRYPAKGRAARPGVWIRSCDTV
jgi:hypothetical protein